jgi:GNAT superfamily N-acetyltransferase
METGNRSIHKATIEELSEIMDLYLDCTKKMNADGLFNWNETYPGVETITADIESEALYVYRQESLKGAMALNQSQPAEYKKIEWECKLPEFLIIKRLAIDPAYQRQGIAFEMMAFAELFAAEQHFTSIRLDVYSSSQPARLLYRKLHYKEIAEFHFPGIDLPFIAMEKVIT